MILAELKRMKEGDSLTLVNSDMPDHRYLGLTRKIAKMQTNALMFEGGSWLDFPKVKDFRSTKNGFIVSDCCMLEYKKEE